MRVGEALGADEREYPHRPTSPTRPGHNGTQLDYGFLRENLEAACLDGDEAARARAVPRASAERAPVPKKREGERRSQRGLREVSLSLTSQSASLSPKSEREVQERLEQQELLRWGGLPALPARGRYAAMAVGFNHTVPRTPVLHCSESGL